MTEREDESREDKESRDEEGSATEGKSDGEGSAQPDESSGGESSGDDEGSGEASESGDDGSEDDGRTAPAYEFSGGESSGEGGADEEDDDDSDEEPKAGGDDDSDDDESGGDDQRTAPAYEFSGGESSGDGDDSGDDDSDEEEDDEPKPAPRTAATTQWHPSRKDEEKARRKEREAEPSEDEKSGRKKKRILILAAVLGVAALIVLVAVVVSSLGTEKAETGGSEVKGPAVGNTAVDKRFAGIPQDGLSLGNPDAPVTLVEFADLQCPFCRDASNSTLPTLVDKYVRPGKLRIEFRNFAILGPESEKAARALEGAADQGKAWQFIDLFYLNQGEENTGYVTDDFIRKIASGIKGIDAEAVVDASNDLGKTETVGAARTEANKFGINSTPSYLIGRTGEEPTQFQVQDPNNPDQFGQAIDRIAGQQE